MTIPRFTAAEQIFERAKELDAALGATGLSPQLRCAVLGAAYLLALERLTETERAVALSGFLMLSSLVDDWIAAEADREKAN